MKIEYKGVELKFHVVEAEKRTRHYPGFPAYANFDLRDMRHLEAKLGREINEEEWKELREYAFEEAARINEQT